MSHHRRADGWKPHLSTPALLHRFIRNATSTHIPCVYSTCTETELLNIRPAAYKWCLISLHHTVDHEYVWRTVFIHECFCFMVSGIFLDDSVWCYCVCVVWIVAMCYHGWCQWVWWCWKRYVQMNRINFWGSLGFCIFVTQMFHLVSDKK